MPPSPRQRLATLLLGHDVLRFIADRRANGDTWTDVRDALRDATDGEIDVTWQAVQQWHRNRPADEADVA